MSDQQASNDRDLATQAANGYAGAHQQISGIHQNFQSQQNAQGQWWNPDNDANDMIGSTFGMVYLPVAQWADSSTQNNLDVAHGHLNTMRATVGNNQAAEDASTSAVTLNTNGGPGNGN